MAESSNMLIMVLLAVAGIWLVISHSGQSNVICSTVVNRPSEMDDTGMYNEGAKNVDWISGANEGAKNVDWISNANEGASNVDWIKNSGYEKAGARKTKSVSKMTNLQFLKSKRNDYSKRASSITPETLLPPNMRRDKSKHYENMQKLDWVEGFTPTNEGQIKDANWLRYSSQDFQAQRDPFTKNKSVDIRGVPPVRMHTGLSLWKEMPVQTNQDSDMLIRPLNGPSRLGGENRRLRQELAELKSMLKPDNPSFKEGLMGQGQVPGHKRMPGRRAY